MAIDTTVQPWIAKMLSPADPRLMAAAIKDFEHGFAGSYLAAREGKRQEAIASGQTPPTPSGFERAMKGAYWDIASDVSQASAKRLESERTVDETLSLDLSTISDEVGSLKTSTEILQWVAKNSAMAASPTGARVLGQIAQNARAMAQIETESLGYIAARKIAEDRAELMVKYGLGPDATPQQFAEAHAKERMTQRAPTQIEADEALVKQREAQARFNEARAKAVEEGKTTTGTVPIIERKLQLYEQALASGDKTRIQAFENDLGLNKLSPSNKAAYDAEIKAIDRDLGLVNSPEEYLKRRVDLVKKYFNAPAAPAATTPSTNAPPGSRDNPIKFNFKDGKLMRVN